MTKAPTATASPSAIAELSSSAHAAKTSARATGSDRARSPRSAGCAMPGSAARSAARRAVAHRLVRASHLPHGDRLDGGYSSRRAVRNPSAGGQPAGTPPGPAGDAGAEGGDARRAPVPRRLCAQPRTARRSGSRTRTRRDGRGARRRAATPAPTERPRGSAPSRDRRRRDRRGPSRSRRRRCRARHGPLRRGRRRLSPRAPGGPGVPQPDRRPARDLEVSRVARHMGRVQVDPGDARGTELETGRVGRVIAREWPAQPARASGHRLLVHPVQQPARGDEVARIAVVPVSLEEHEAAPAEPERNPVSAVSSSEPRGSGRAPSAVIVAQMGGAGARVGAEGRIPGAIREGVERQDDAGLTHADAVVGDAPGGVVGPAPRAGDLRAVGPFGACDHPAHALERARPKALRARDLEQLQR